MPLNHDIVGVDSEPAERTWTETDVLLYALAVGAGQEDPLAELKFTTENSAGIQLQVLPTFGNLIGARGKSRSLGDFDPANLVHAEQAFMLHRPLPTAPSLLLSEAALYHAEEPSLRPVWARS